jgi:uncharacterized protein YgiM (DUF1202 family)
MLFVKTFKSADYTYYFIYIPVNSKSKSSTLVKNISVFNVLSVALALVFIISCSKSNDSNVLVTQLEAIQKEHVPDRRIEVFNIITDDSTGAISIETTSTSASDAIASAPELANIPVKLLPDVELGDQLHAVVRISVANLRRDPRHQAELIDQAVMGTQLKVLKKRGGWYFIQTPWQYLGWITGASLEFMTADELDTEWKNSNLVYVNAVDTRVYETMQTTQDVVSDVTMGATLKLISSRGRFAEVQLPDGRTGFINASEVTALKPVDNSVSPDKSSIVQTAQRFHGLPYLWGGNSGKGFDCSGFTQTVFKDNGYLLPRDANMQVNIGEEVIASEDFSNIQAGDLLFFGPNENRITHVGISLGGARFIHASSYVQINSFDPNDPDYDEGRFSTLRAIKRI